jgi:predicted unusual protein kinase regulating ubiquinone biosynthesis (AarF/ABC1/UbiB family)
MDFDSIFRAVGQAVNVAVVRATADDSPVVNVIGGVVTSMTALANVVADGAQRDRLGELIDRLDFGQLVAALNGEQRFDAHFLPDWIRRAGGYFPKFAQVLSVRADLVHDREVLAALGRCLEEMPARPEHEVVALLREQLSGVPVEEVVAALRECLNAGSVAQVHRLELPTAGPAVLKVTWPSTRARFEADFRLFGHAHTILRAVSSQPMDEARVGAIASMFEAVGRAETSVLREFDLVREL